MIRSVLRFIALLFVVCLLWAIAWFVGILRLTRGLDQRWPADLGTARAAPKRYQSNETNAAARKLQTLALRIGISLRLPNERADATTAAEKQFKSLSGPLLRYVRQEIERPTDEIRPPEKALADFLAVHERDLAALRNHLLTSPQPILWKQEVENHTLAPLSPPIGCGILNRTLVAHGLDAGRRGNRNVAWEDLHAAWALQRSLWRRADFVSALLALSATRVVNSAARKLPAPEPEWCDELRRFDYRQQILATFQMETSFTARTIAFAPAFNRATGKARVPEPFLAPVNWLMLPYGACAGGNYASAMNKLAVDLAKSDRCGFDAASTQRRFKSSLAWWNTLGRESIPDLELWPRLARFQAEMEGTSKVLALKRLHWPQAVSDIAESQCSDGTWRYQPRTLEFSEQIPKEKGDSIAYPLRYIY